MPTAETEVAAPGPALAPAPALVREKMESRRSVAWLWAKERFKR